ncbi:MAG: hypothetical protein CTY15_06795 [Methylocystis sp.]|nr:MAG: hypothetical protein CTY15_06795 [Methylocystis sp.]
MLDPDELKNEPKKPTLVDISHDEGGTQLIFAATRVIVVREELDKDEITDTPNQLDEYSEIFGVKHRYFQSMDTVWIPDKGSVIDVRIDAPRNFSSEAQVAAIGQVKDALKILFGYDYLEHPVNLFPLIDLIYNDANEGNIVEAAFGTSTASHKHEKMRRSHLDLRKELYHKAGKQALASGIALHLISVRWRRKLGGQIESLPELSLHVPVWETGAAQPSLLQGHVRNCMGYEDFDYVRGRMLHHLGL